MQAGAVQPIPGKNPLRMHAGTDVPSAGVHVHARRRCVTNTWSAAGHSLRRIPHGQGPAHTPAPVPNGGAGHNHARRGQI